MKTFKLVVTLMVGEQERSVRVEVQSTSVHWDNDGIGAYEFWGQKGFDRGTDYIAEFEVEKMVDDETDEVIEGKLKEMIVDLLHDDEDFVRDLEAAFGEWESEMEAEAELDRREL